jgi:hypothetical protein
MVRIIRRRSPESRMKARLGSFDDPAEITIRKLIVQLARLQSLRDFDHALPHLGIVLQVALQRRSPTEKLTTMSSFSSLSETTRGSR